MLMRGDEYMPIVIKVDQNWAPSENTLLKVGEQIYVTDASALLREGKVKLVEESRKASDVDATGTVCPECDFVAKNKNGLRFHMKKHA